MSKKTKFKNVVEYTVVEIKDGVWNIFKTNRKGLGRLPTEKNIKVFTDGKCKIEDGVLKFYGVRNFFEYISPYKAVNGTGFTDFHSKEQMDELHDMGLFDEKIPTKNYGTYKKGPLLTEEESYVAGVYRLKKVRVEEYIVSNFVINERCFIDKVV